MLLTSSEDSEWCIGRRLLLTKQVLLTREGVDDHITTLEQRGLRLGKDVAGLAGLTGLGPAKLGVKRLEVGGVEQVECRLELRAGGNCLRD